MPIQATSKSLNREELDQLKVAKIHAKVPIRATNQRKNEDQGQKEMQTLPNMPRIVLKFQNNKGILDWEQKSHFTKV